MSRIWTIFLICAGLALLATTGCQKADQNEQAIKTGLEEYLKNRAGLDMNSMEMKLNSVNFRGSEADVSVSFQAKGATDPSTGMQMKYVMEQQGGKWVVKGRSGTSEHGGADQAPMPSGGSGMEMPSGHPPTTGGGGEKK